MANFDLVASELESISRHLRRAGEGELVAELNAAIRRAVRPVPEVIRAGLKPRLPDRYAAVLDSDLALGTSIRAGERNPGVVLRGTTRGAVARRRLHRLDAGVLAHPLWGNRRRWFDQPVQAGWFTRPAEDAQPRVRAEIERALEEVSAKAARKGP